MTRFHAHRGGCWQEVSDPHQVGLSFWFPKMNGERAEVSRSQMCCTCISDVLHLHRRGTRSVAWAALGSPWEGHRSGCDHQEVGVSGAVSEARGGLTPRPQLLLHCCLFRALMNANKSR